MNWCTKTGPIGVHSWLCYEKEFVVWGSGSGREVKGMSREPFIYYSCQTKKVWAALEVTSPHPYGNTATSVVGT